MNDTYNSDEFLSAVQNEALETRFTPVPVGDFPAAAVQKTVKVKKVVFPSGDERAEFEMQWQIDGEVAGMKNPKVRQRFLLDTQGFAANGAPILEAGLNKNVRLGKLIALSGQDASNWSFAGLELARGRIKVTHRPDKTDPDNVYAEVSAVAPL